MDILKFSTSVLQVTIAQTAILSEKDLFQDKGIWCSTNSLKLFSFCISLGWFERFPFFNFCYWMRLMIMSSQSTSSCSLYWSSIFCRDTILKKWSKHLYLGLAGCRLKYGSKENPLNIKQFLYNHQEKLSVLNINNRIFYLVIEESFHTKWFSFFEPYLRRQSANRKNTLLWMQYWWKLRYFSPYVDPVSTEHRVEAILYIRTEYTMRV